MAAALLSVPACGPEADRPEAAAVEDRPGRVVAEVNGEPIFEQQVDRVKAAERMRLAEDSGAAASSDPRELRRRALAMVIDAELLYQAAREAGLRAPEEQLDRRLAVARSQFASEEDFREHLRSSGLSEERWRRRAERRLLVELYLRTITPASLDLEEEARRIYEAQKEPFAGAESVRVSHILVRLRPGDPSERREQARARIAEAHRRALAGEDFGLLAAEYSDSPTAADLGDLGLIRRGRMLPEFEKVVFETPVGRVSPIFETPLGLNVIRVVERLQAEPRSFEEVEPALTLVLARERADEALRRHVEQLRSRATIRILDPEPEARR